jgi:predicted DNA-binding transcriptional regulator AlpA
MTNNYQADHDRGSWSINEFCRRHGFSRRSFYNLLENGAGPRVMRVGGRRLVSRQAELDWIAAREQAGDDAA